jgi:hypothetical protein
MHTVLADVPRFRALACGEPRNDTEAPPAMRNYKLAGTTLAA